MMAQFISPNLDHRSGQQPKAGLHSRLKCWFSCLALYRYLVSGFCLLVSTQLLLAETVQRWQDAQGQWHFGDHAAAKGQNSQPVFITAPISIIKNDQPAAAKGIEAPVKPKKSGNTEKRRVSRNAAVTQKTHCDTLRQQLYDRTPSSKKSQSYQVLAQRYDQECVAGHYYGN